MKQCIKPNKCTLEWRVQSPSASYNLIFLARSCQTMLGKASLCHLAIPIQSTVIWRLQLQVIFARFWFYLYWYRAIQYTFRGPNILLKQYTSKQGFGSGHPGCLQKKTSYGRKSSFLGGEGVRRFMAKVIKSFHFFGPFPKIQTVITHDIFFSAFEAIPFIWK